MTAILRDVFQGNTADFKPMKPSGVPWIGDIPVGWTTRKLKYCSTFLQRKYSDDCAELPYVGLENVVSWNGKYIETESQYDRQQAILFKKGDILWGKLRPYLAKVYHSAGDGCCSGEFCVIRMNQQFDSRYYWNLLISSEFVATVDRSTYGTKMPRANAGDIKSIVIPIPPLDEQHRIAAYLDAECARIDGVIEKTRASIEEYKKLRQSVITEAVTKGIRKGRAMKESGIEWIGEIPGDWNVSSLGAVTRSMRNGYVGPTKDLFVDEGVRYIQSLHIKDGGIDFDKHEYHVSEEWANIHPKIKTDDVLIVQTGDIGSVALVGPEFDGCNCHALIIATPNTSLVLPAFLTYYLRSTVGKELLLYYKTGALLPHLNSGKIKFASVCFPTSKEEQAEIVAHLDRESAKIDRIIEKKQELLSALETYKKSLIYETVTGKKEVPA